MSLIELYDHEDNAAFLGGSCWQKGIHSFRKPRAGPLVFCIDELRDMLI